MILFCVWASILNFSAFAGDSPQERVPKHLRSHIMTYLQDGEIARLATTSRQNQDNTAKVQYDRDNPVGNAIFREIEAWAQVFVSDYHRDFFRENENKYIEYFFTKEIHAGAWFFRKPAFVKEFLKNLWIIPGPQQSQIRVEAVKYLNSHQKLIDWDSTISESPLSPEELLRFLLNDAKPTLDIKNQFGPKTIRSYQVAELDPLLLRIFQERPICLDLKSSETLDNVLIRFYRQELKSRDLFLKVSNLKPSLWLETNSAGESALQLVLKDEYFLNEFFFDYRNTDIYKNKELLSFKDRFQNNIAHLAIISQTKHRTLVLSTKVVQFMEKMAPELLTELNADNKTPWDLWVESLNDTFIRSYFTNHNVEFIALLSVSDSRCLGFFIDNLSRLNISNGELGLLFDYCLSHFDRPKTQLLITKLISQRPELMEKLTQWIQTYFFSPVFQKHRRAEQAFLFSLKNSDMNTPAHLILKSGAYLTLKISIFSALVDQLIALEHNSAGETPVGIWTALVQSRETTPEILEQVFLYLAIRENQEFNALLAREILNREFSHTLLTRPEILANLKPFFLKALSTKNTAFAKEILKTCPEFYVQRYDQNQNLLHLATAQMVTEILETHPTYLRETDLQGLTPFQVAASKGDREKVKILIPFEKLEWNGQSLRKRQQRDLLRQS